MLPNLGFLWVFFKYPKIAKNGNLLFFPWLYSEARWTEAEGKANKWHSNRWSIIVLLSGWEVHSKPHNHFYFCIRIVLNVLWHSAIYSVECKVVPAPDHDRGAGSEPSGEDHCVVFLGIYFTLSGFPPRSIKMDTSELSQWSWNTMKC